MILALALLVLSAQDATQQRHLLPNGSVLYVEQRQDEKAVSVQLFASTRGVPERPDAHGRRHLLEHLMAKGDGSLDARLETEGMFLAATTYRDAMQFSITCPPDKLTLALEVVRDLLVPFATTPQAIAREAKVMRQEAEMRPSEAVLSSAAWRGAYGANGLDPMGTHAAILSTTPKQLTDLHAALFGAERLALTIVGPIDLDRAVAAGRTSLRAAGPEVRESAPVREPGVPGSIRAEVPGEVLAAMVPSVRDPRTTWALAAALVLAARVGDAFVTYTPSAGSGLVIVGRTETGNELAMALRALTPQEIFDSHAFAQKLVRDWVVQPLDTGAGTGWIRGLLLCQGASLKPEILLENVESMGRKDLDTGFAMFSPSQGVAVAGVGR